MPTLKQIYTFVVGLYGLVFLFWISRGPIWYHIDSESGMWRRPAEWTEWHRQTASPDGKAAHFRHVSNQVLMYASLVVFIISLIAYRRKVIPIKNNVEFFMVASAIFGLLTLFTRNFNTGLPEIVDKALGWVYLFF